MPNFSIPANCFSPYLSILCLFSLYSTFKDSFTVKRYNLYCVQFSLKVKKLIN